nr:SR-related and CTD-associated factor 4-like [Anolis sagrei ordinatus]
MGQANSIPSGSPLDTMCRLWDRGLLQRHPDLRRKKMIKLCTKTWPGYNAAIANPEEYWSPWGSFKPGPLRRIRCQLQKHHIEQLDYLALWEAYSEKKAAREQDVSEAKKIHKEDAPVLGVNEKPKTRRAPPPPPPVALPHPSPAPSAVQTSPAPVVLPPPPSTSNVVPPSLYPVASLRQLQASNAIQPSPAPVALPHPSPAPSAVQTSPAPVVLPPPPSTSNVVPPSPYPVASPRPMQASNAIQPSPAPVVLPPPSSAPNAMPPYLSPAALPHPSSASNVVPPSPYPVASPHPLQASNAIQPSPAPVALPHPSPALNAVPPSSAPVVLPPPSSTSNVVPPSPYPVESPRPLQASNAIQPSPAPVALPHPSQVPNVVPPFPAPVALPPPSSPIVVSPTPASMGPAEKLAPPSPLQNETSTSNTSLQDLETRQQPLDSTQKALEKPEPPTGPSQIWLQWDLEECKKLAGTFETDPNSFIRLLERMFSTYNMSYQRCEELLIRMLTEKELDCLWEKERTCYDGGSWREGKKQAREGLPREVYRVRLVMDRNQLLSHLRKMANEQQLAKFMVCRTKQNESPQQFWSRFLQEAKLACLDPDNPDDQVALRSHFIFQSHNFILDYFQDHYPGWCSYSTEKVLELAQSIWEEEKEKEKEKEEEEEKEFEKMAKMIKVALQETYGNGGGQGGWGGRRGGGRWRNKACYLCGKMGHIMRDCYWNTGTRW